MKVEKIWSRFEFTNRAYFSRHAKLAGAARFRSEGNSGNAAPGGA